MNEVLFLLKHLCFNKNSTSFINYGGRGIIVCDEWKNDFSIFFNWATENGYSEELTIDRINVNGNYEPENCRWITNKEQQNNRRDNHFIYYKNQKHTIAEWSEVTGLSYDLIWSRKKVGKKDDEIFIPTKKYLFENENDIKDIIRLYTLEHYSARKIAKIYKTTHKTIISLLKRIGVI